MGSAVCSAVRFREGSDLETGQRSQQVFNELCWEADRRRMDRSAGRARLE